MRSPEAGPGWREAVVGLTQHPYERLIARWNWKSAILSSIVRALIFFAATLGAGVHAAAGAALAEWVFRACTSGFYGAVTEAFVAVRPVCTGTAAALIVLPLLSHSLELLVHYTRGTPDLTRAIGSSIAFTLCSTAFNLFAMRHGLLQVGRGRPSLLADLRRLPRLLCVFAADLFMFPLRLMAR